MPYLLFSRITGVQCPELQISGNLQTTVNGPHRAAGTVVTFECHDGYQLIGKSSVRCQSEGQWSGEIPQCTEDIQRKSSKVYDVAS